LLYNIGFGCYDYAYGSRGTCGRFVVERYS
jgi:hypothetical protein